jgi:hypothetical protein
MVQTVKGVPESTIVYVHNALCTQVNEQNYEQACQKEQEFLEGEIYYEAGLFCRRLAREGLARRLRSSDGSQFL